MEEKAEGDLEWDFQAGIHKQPLICWKCEKERKEAQRIDTFLNSIDAWLWQNLTRIGLSPREIRADLAKVPKEIKAKLPSEIIKDMMSGMMGHKGFGIGGNTGAGKTMAIAAIVKAMITACAKERIKTKQIPDPSGKEWPTFLLWSSWPDEVQWLRPRAISPEAPERIEILANVPLLILDDLGRERIKGSYLDDWAASQLDSVINGRHRNELPIVWTTNVTEIDLVNLYGAALVRRLTADNPLIWIN